MLITPQVEGKAECLYRMMKGSTGVPSSALMFQIPKESSLLLYLSLLKNIFKENKAFKKNRNSQLEKVVIKTKDNEIRKF